MIDSYPILGVRIHALQIPTVVEVLEKWSSQEGTPRRVCVTGMHGVIEAKHDRAFQEILNHSDLNVADGWPVMFMGRLLGRPMRRRVYGPELMQAVMESSSNKSHFFYGGAPGVAQDLASRMKDRYGIRIAGTHTPPYEPFSPRENPDVLAKINRSRADYLWIGLSTPKQEKWMATRQPHLKIPVMIGVGAAFDFHTGRTKQAPMWIRENGLEWGFRLFKEPRRLWKRYLIGGSEFCVRILMDIFTGRFRGGNHVLEKS